MEEFCPWLLSYWGQVAANIGEGGNIAQELLTSCIAQTGIVLEWGKTWDLYT